MTSCFELFKNALISSSDFFKCNCDPIITQKQTLSCINVSTLIFQRFKTPPTVFVTASHQSLNRPQDAMAVWVEDLHIDKFKICLKEAKIFSGAHKNIKIVSLLDSITNQRCKITFIFNTIQTGGSL